MATYNASINIGVQGVAEVQKVSESISNLERLIAGIKPVPSLFDRKGSADTQKALNDLTALVKEYAAAGISSTKFATSISGLNAQISTFQRITASARAGSDQFKNSIIASERATLSLVAAEQERLKVLRSIYTGPQSKQGGQGTLASSELNSVFKIAQKTIPTIAGITEQVRVLERALENIDIGTPIFKNVENLIAQRQSLLADARLGGQSSKLPKSAVSTPVQVGLAGTHATTLAGMKAQSTYYNKIEDLQYKQLVTGQQISKANLTQTQQEELQNRLAQASQALAEGELRVATRLTTELRSQRLAYERINSVRKTEASKTQTFGALGTGFLPVTGKMPGGDTISGSPARLKALQDGTKIEVAAVQSLQTQKTKALQDGTRIEVAAVQSLQLQKTKALQDGTRIEVAAVQSLQTQKTKALQDGTRTEVAAVQSLQLQKTKALQEDTTNRRRTDNLVKSSEILEQGLIKAKKAGLDVDTETQHVRRVINTLAQQGLNFSKLQLDETDHILEGLRDELSLKKAIAQNNAVPKAVTSRGTVASVVTRQERLTNTAELLEQSLLQAKIKGLDVDHATVRVRQVINTLNRADLSTDISQLAVLDKTIKTLQHELKLKKAIAQTQKPQGGKAGGGGKAGKADAGGFFERLSNPSSKLGSAVIGGGFPALMGGGPGAMIGGALGGAVGGFAGSIAASAIGQFLDQAVVSVQTLGNAFALVQDDYSAIRETGIQFTAELESQVRAAKQLGDYTKANKLQQSALTVIGDISASTGSQTSATEGVTASVNRLNAAWNLTTKSVSMLLGLLGAPFMEVISVILLGVYSVALVLNSIITGIGGLLAKLSTFASKIKDGNQEALKTTAEYQNQIAQQDKLIEQAIRLNKANAELNTFALENVGLLGAEKQAADLKLRSIEKQAALEEEIRKIKETVPPGATEEQKIKGKQLEAQAEIKFNNEVFKDQVALYGSLYDQITADNISIARQKEDQERNYRDMVRDTARLQQDLNQDIARKAQDLRVQNIEKENELIKRQADLRISGLELESKKRLSSMAEFVPGIDTEEQQIKIGVTEAVDTLKIGLAKIDAEAADRQRKLKTNLIRLDIENERYKYDMALRISRLNVDNINKIAVINTQINRQNQDASRQKYKDGLELLRAQLQAGVSATTREVAEAKQHVNLAEKLNIDTEGYKNTVIILEDRARSLQVLVTSVSNLLGKLPEALPSVQQLPTVSGDTSAVTSGSNRLTQLIIDSDRISEEETQAKRAGVIQAQRISFTQQATSPAKPVQGLREANDKLLLSEKARLAVIQTGINPELFEQQTLNTQTYETALKRLKVLQVELAVKKGVKEISEKTYISATSYIDEVIALLGIEYAALQKNTLELQKQKQITETAAFLSVGKRQVQGVEAGMRSGFIGQAQSTYADKITQGFSSEQATAMAAQTQALELATTKARALEGAYNDIGSAMTSTLTDGVAGLVAGTTTAEQVFADFLKNVGDALMKAAQQMIAQYAAIAVAKALAGLSGAPSGGGASQGFGMAEIAPGFGPGPQRMFGGGKAAGGPVSSNSTYMVGERGPELFVPGSNGMIVPAGPTAGIREAMASGASAATAPVLNMSFETTRIGNTDYVSREQLEAAMLQTRAEATRAGARRGMTMTLDKLQQSPSTRSRVGLG